MSYIKTIVLLAIMLFPSLYGNTLGCNISKTHSVITVKEKTVQGVPKTSSIQASINGHTLSVVFTENLGEVQVEVTDSTGGTVDYWDIWTPNGYIVYIYDPGSYVVTFTLPNGDEYYGEFEVTD